jgi:serine/threonine protein kinase
MTDLLETPSAEAIARVCFLWLTCSLHGFEYVVMHYCSVACPHPCNNYFCWTILVLYWQVRNEKARRYLSSMRKKKPIPFSQKFPNADPLALRLLERMLAFEPKDRPTAEEVKYLCLFILLFTIYILYWGEILCSCCQALADPYFKGLAKVEREPSAQPVTKMEFEFERRRITKEDVRELIYREILEYHPKMLKEFLEGAEPTGFMYPRYSYLKLNTDFSTISIYGLSTEAWL